MTVPTAHRIRLALENAIIDGSYLPGDRIDPDRVAAEYHCSRTPVREALQALEVSGLLVVQPKRGTYVVQLSVTELMERFEVMAELEAFCARLAARRADAEDLESMRRALSECETAADAGDSDRYYIVNAKFHQAIYRAAHNEFLKAEALRLQAVLQPYRRRQLQARGRIHRSLEEHSRIAERIATGDSEGAAKAMADHVLVQGESAYDVIALLGRHPSPATPANWKQGEDVIVTAAVSDEDATERFGGCDRALPYLRTTRQPE